MSLHDDMVAIGQRALAASRELVPLKTRKKNNILLAMADELEARREAIQAANATDIEEGRNAGLSDAMLDRLLLTDARIDGMITGIQDVAALKDPIGTNISRWIRPNGLEIVKRRVPIGVIGIIYESRPNVTADSAVLCFKASNAVILRGGKEAVHSNAAIADALIEGGRKKGLPENAIQLIRTTDREAVKELVRLEGTVDLVIPRGGEALIRAVTEMAHVPVIKHYKGVCSLYIDEEADIEMGLGITVNAKCQRPGVCNAIETLLVHEAIAAEFLPKAAELLEEKGVELRGDPAARAIVPAMKEATEQDWYEEYLDLVLAVRVVESTEAAIAHINTYGSRHSDAIVTESDSARKVFLRDVDSSTVYVNASTRFTDGGEFGMGAEIGISTDKLHARGPMGLEELTTYKYLVHGKGQIRP
ncbi:MAG: glutamate-5-semialdehyde dehydrogenase [Kiritimatiellia bacterium]|nr:glutamate-5-semialdehyde dehydrogenase [Kiritimatiellia bacterium]MDP6630190.1 glutamate-5-semialdehyde dehydrogenase [Kiritimatiellia bacterium]MDP6810722.1 glutamate-5-semialdehyde dehydrogenase [Kiritimatiellia bacterium]MDP7023291.1 glutamate-5-semialdehyde dehydrogenase [Kiritimatiellia bacterium]